jgi:G6PDH family F420-dependent oxidoreductase
MSSALQATERVSFNTGVTAPIMRYNPAIVAQAFATMGAMYPGRVVIGVGSGEELNEMAVLGGEWPSPGKRLEMLEEALTVINTLWTSTEPVSFAGKYYTLNNAVVLTKPEEKVPVYVSAIGPRAAKLAGRLGDHLITVVTDPKYVKEELMPNFEAGAREAGKDPSTMRRLVSVFYYYDPNYAIADYYADPELQKSKKSSSSEAKVEIADAMEAPLLVHSAEDIIKRVEELKRMGYDVIGFGNWTSNAMLRWRIETLRQSAALPTATLDRFSSITLDEAGSLKVWEDVLPHIR